MRRSSRFVSALLALSTLCCCNAAPLTVPLPGRPPESTELVLPAPRAVHEATELLDGRVLLTGGCSTPGCGGFDLMRQSVFFNPVTADFSSGPTMISARAGGTSTRLADGRVLLVGGYAGEGADPIAHAELFDPATETFAAVGDLTTPRADHSATLMPDGTVMVVGGSDGRSALASTEIFNPSIGRFLPGPTLTTGRSGHAAVLMASGLVVIAGTADEANAINSTELLIEETWRGGPVLAQGRVKHGAAALGADRILVMGGATDVEGRIKLDSTEIMALSDFSVRPGPNLAEAVYKLDGSVATLADGRVIIAGGTTLQLYDPVRNSIESFGEKLAGSRSFATLTVVGTDQLLLVGGYDTSITPSNSVSLQDIDSA